MLPNKERTVNVQDEGRWVVGRAGTKRNIRAMKSKSNHAMFFLECTQYACKGRKHFSTCFLWKLYISPSVVWMHSDALQEPSYKGHLIRRKPHNSADLILLTAECFKAWLQQYTPHAGYRRHRRHRHHHCRHSGSRPAASFGCQNIVWREHQVHSGSKFFFTW
jgi:hypothetical protein